MVEFIELLLAITDYFSRCEANITKSACHFDDLWTFYAPRSLVSANVQDDDQIFEVESCQPPTSPNALYLNIICSMVDLDGYDFVKKSYSLQIPYYTGQRSLRNLPVILLDYYPEKQPLLIHMRHRDSGFRELYLLNSGSKTARKYEGPCFVASEGQEKLIDIRGRIVIGPLSYL